ncbi:MAG: hypothetical protein KDD70_13730 [Bdellovibrionales bacterium]|nr:hypothetical protein [Bdellovibrionales bacterium]
MPNPGDHHPPHSNEQSKRWWHRLEISDEEGAFLENLVDGSAFEAADFASRMEELTLALPLEFSAESISERSISELCLPESPVNIGDIPLVPAKEIKAYLAVYPDALQNHLDNLYTQIPPMDPACKLSICIPVAALEEANYIAQALQAYKSQSAPPENWEIVLFCNWPANEEDPSRLRNIETVRNQIATFRSEHPELRVYSVESALPEELQKIGAIRKLGTDVVLMRHIERPERPSDDHIIVRNDADTTAVHTNYVSHNITLMEKHPKTDMFVGKLDYSLHDYAKDPYVYLGTRLWLAIEASRRILHQSFEGGGANVAFRAGTYARVGGYRRDIEAAEDCALGEAFNELRTGAKEFTPIANAGYPSKIYTSCRRIFHAAKQNVISACQWSDPATKFQSEDPAVRVQEHHFDSDNFRKEVLSEGFREAVEDVVNDTLSKYYAGSSNLRLERKLRVRKPYKQAVSLLLRRMGFQFHYKPTGMIAITGANDAKQHFLHFAENVDEHLRRRISPRPGID